ncbi:MAG: AMP-binding protein [Pseudomonadota bacterium]
MQAIQQGPTAPELTLRALSRYGDAIAFSGHGGSLTYAESRDLVGRYQRVFSDAGMRRGERVALLSANRADAWLALLAAQALGLCGTSLHPLGSLADHLFVLEDAAIDYLIVDAEAYGERGGELSVSAPALKQTFTIGRISYGRDLSVSSASVGSATPRVDAEPLDAAMLGYTGGTTGKSKGAIRQHPSVVAMTNAVLSEFEWPTRTTYLSVAPMSHVGGTKLAPTLLRGGRVHFHHGFDPDRILYDIEAEGVSVTLLVPTMIYVLLDHPKLSDADLSSLELLLYGASPMSPTRLSEGLERIGPVFSQLYGQTECYPISVLPRAAHSAAEPELMASCGRLCSSVSLALLGESGQVVEAGDVGEICVRAPQAMNEYLGRPEQTADAFAGGWLHTGDMARADDRGYLYIVDRKKDLIISGGFNVYPREIEDILSADPTVASAAVIGVPDEKWGEAVKAVVVARGDSVIDPQALIERVKAVKGSVEAPKSVDVVSELPLTAIGKPDKKALRERYWHDRDRRVG